MEERDREWYSFDKLCFIYRINKIGHWDEAKKLTLLINDTLDLRNDLTNIHFSVATSGSFPPTVRTKAIINPMSIPPGYRVCISWLDILKLTLILILVLREL